MYRNLLDKSYKTINNVIKGISGQYIFYLEVEISLINDPLVRAITIKCAART